MLQEFQALFDALEDLGVFKDKRTSTLLLSTPLHHSSLRSTPRGFAVRQHSPMWDSTTVPAVTNALSRLDPVPNRPVEVYHCHRPNQGILLDPLVNRVMEVLQGCYTL